MIRVACPEKVLDKLDHVLLVAVRHLATVALEYRPQQNVLDGLGHAPSTTAVVTPTTTATSTAIPNRSHSLAVLPLSPPLLLLLLRLHTARPVVVMMMVVVVVVFSAAAQVSVQAAPAVLRRHRLLLGLLGRLSLRRLIAAAERGRSHEHGRRGQPQAVAAVHLGIVAERGRQTGRGRGGGRGWKAHRGCLVLALERVHVHAVLVLLAVRSYGGGCGGARTICAGGRMTLLLLLLLLLAVSIATAVAAAVAVIITLLLLLLLLLQLLQLLLLLVQL